MTGRRCLLAVATCLVALAGCGGSHSKSTTSDATRRPATPATPNAAAAHDAVSRFAGAYVRFLDGDRVASELPDATAGVRALARQSGSVPATRRRGTLMMTQLRPAVGNPRSYLVTARDDAHVFYAQMTLADRHGHWLVVKLTPPDFEQVLAPAGPPPPALPPGSGAADAATRLFLRGYLPWLYGQTPLRAIPSSTSRLLVDLKTHQPRIPPTMRTLRPKVAAIARQRRGRGWQALPNITDGRETYQLVLTVTKSRDRWLVSAVSSTTR